MIFCCFLLLSPIPVWELARRWSVCVKFIFILSIHMAVATPKGPFQHSGRKWHSSILEKNILHRLYPLRISLWQGLGQYGVLQNSSTNYAALREPMAMDRHAYVGFQCFTYMQPLLCSAHFPAQRALQKRHEDMNSNSVQPEGWRAGIPTCLLISSLWKFLRTAEHKARCSMAIHPTSARMEGEGSRVLWDAGGTNK